jgi:hypothetical protein
VLVTADAVEAREENFMARLTDTQLIVLSAAVAREDGVAVVPAKMKWAAASKVGASLIARRLMREARSKPGMPVWREDDGGRPISLVITRAGREAIGVDEDARSRRRGSEMTQDGRFEVGEGNGYSGGLGVESP